MKQLVFFRSDAVRLTCSTKCLGRFTGRWLGGMLERYVPVAVLPLVSMGVVGGALVRPCERVILVNVSGHLGSGRTEIRADETLSFSSRVPNFQLMLFSFLLGIGPVQWRVGLYVSTCSAYSRNTLIKRDSDLI